MIKQAWQATSTFLLPKSQPRPEMEREMKADEEL